MSTLLNDLHAFLDEQRSCRSLESGVENDRVWMTCDGCGARIVHALGRVADRGAQTDDRGGRNP